MKADQFSLKDSYSGSIYIYTIYHKLRTSRTVILVLYTYIQYTINYVHLMVTQAEHPKTCPGVASLGPTISYKDSLL